MTDLDPTVRLILLGIIFGACVWWAFEFKGLIQDIREFLKK